MARPRSDIRSRIVRAARVRFLTEGVDGASLRTVANDAGTNVGMVFYYFPTKDDLFLAVVEEVYVVLLRDLGAALAGDAPARERFKKVFVRLGRASEDELAVVRLMVREALLSSERFGRIFARMQRGHIAMLLHEVERGMRAGEFDPAVPVPLALIATIALGGMPQLVRRAAGDRAPFSSLPPPEELAEASVGLLFRALGDGGRRAGKRKKGRKGKKRAPVRSPSPLRNESNRRGTAR